MTERRIDTSAESVSIAETALSHARRIACSKPSHNYRIFRQITRALSIQKRSKFVKKKNEHARYTLGIKKSRNLERLITATSQARF